MYWVEPKLIAEITYLTWTTDDLLRHAVYVGLREERPSSSSGSRKLICSPMLAEATLVT